MRRPSPALAVKLTALSAVFPFVLFATPPAAAQCFSGVRDAPPIQGGLLQVGLASTFDINPDCRLALRASDACSGVPPAPGARTFADLVRQLAPTATATPRFVFACPPGGSTSGRETLALADCTLSSFNRLYVRVQSSSRGVQVSREPPPNDALCGWSTSRMYVVPTTTPPIFADTLSLRGFFVPTGANTPPVPYSSNLAVYMSAPTGATALLVGTIRPNDSRTPLQTVLDARGALLAGHPTNTLRPFELRLGPDGSVVLVAPDAVLLHEFLESIAAEGTSLRSATTPSPSPTATFVPIRGGAAIPAAMNSAQTGMSFPSQIVEAEMRDRFGSIGASLVPTLEDWNRILQHTLICGVGGQTRYQNAPSMGQAALERFTVSDATCVRASDVVGMQSLPSIPLTLNRHVTTVIPHVDRSPLPRDPQPAVVSDGGITILATGDSITLPQTYAWRFCTLPTAGTRGTCEVVPGSSVQLTTSGLAQLVAVPRDCATAACTAGRNGLAVRRIVVIDPERDWMPVGLGVPRWQEVSWEGSAAIVREGWHSARTALRIAPSAFVAIPSDEPRQLQADLVDGAWDSPSAAHTALLTVRVSTDSRCPTSATENLDAARMAPSQLAWAHLGERTTANGFRCIARVRLVGRARFVASVSLDERRFATFTARIGGASWVGAFTDFRGGGLTLAQDLFSVAWEPIHHPVFGRIGLELASQIHANGVWDGSSWGDFGLTPLTARFSIGPFFPRSIPLEVALGWRWMPSVLSTGTPFEHSAFLMLGAHF